VQAIDFHIAIRTRKLCRLSWLNWFFQVHQHMGIILVFSSAIEHPLKQRI